MACVSGGCSFGGHTFGGYTVGGCAFQSVPSEAKPLDLLLETASGG